MMPSCSLISNLGINKQLLKMFQEQSFNAQSVSLIFRNITMCYLIYLQQRPPEPKKLVSGSATLHSLQLTFPHCATGLCVCQLLQWASMGQSPTAESVRTAVMFWSFHSEFRMCFNMKRSFKVQLRFTIVRMIMR